MWRGFGLALGFFEAHCVLRNVSGVAQESFPLASLKGRLLGHVEICKSVSGACGFESVGLVSGPLAVARFPHLSRGFSRTDSSAVAAL